MIELQQAAVRRLLQSAVRRLYSVDGGGRRSILVGGWKQSATAAAAYSICMHRSFNLNNHSHTFTLQLLLQLFMHFNARRSFIPFPIHIQCDWHLHNINQY